MKSIVVAIYTHPELYPPVLNVIDELSDLFEQVFVISRNLNQGSWKYASNTQFTASGKYISIGNSEKKSITWKLSSFLRFTADLKRILNKEKPVWIMCNDPISLMSFRLVRRFISFPIRLWYHSHDVTELGMTRKFSVGYFAVKSEQKYFSEIDLFTLPAESRLPYFPINHIKGNWITVPNFPSEKRRSFDYENTWNPGIELKIIYQGRVSNEHGLEEMLDFMKEFPSLRFTIIGPGQDDYMQTLRNKIVELQITDRVNIAKPVAYAELDKITKSHHIGWAVNKPMNVLYSTAAQASNKIYEYAASGLPVIYYKNEHYKKYLEMYSWAFPTDLTVRDLVVIIQKIQSEFLLISENAKTDFHQKLNFSMAFKPVESFLLENLVKSE
jgi:glycosyltransferase involved in cell wall biosynthesis